jgi:hypothetical protein
MPSHSAPRARGRRRSFLSDVVLRHGPHDLIGRMLLAADSELRAKGIIVSFASLDEVVHVNRCNADSWRPILPIFDPTHDGIDTTNCFAVLGYNAYGEAVYAHACRLYDLGDATLADEIESLRLFYPDPERSRGPDERMVVTAPSAARTTGKVAFVGAVWYRPDYRKLDLMRATSPLFRSLSYTRWQSDFAFSFMAEPLVRAGIAVKGTYPNVEWEVSMQKTPVYREGTLRAALVWSSGADQIASFQRYLDNRRAELSLSGERQPQIDAVVQNRSA